MYMQSDLVEIKVTDCAGTIILNRPEQGNRLTRSMLEQIGEALDDLYLEKKVRAIILTGAGDAFCEGFDWEEMKAEEGKTLQQQSWGDDAAAWRDLVLRMLEIPKPIIASVNGLALSAGAGLGAGERYRGGVGQRPFWVARSAAWLGGGRCVAPVVSSFGGGPCGKAVADICDARCRGFVPAWFVS